MVFSSFTFVFYFLPATIVTYYASKNRVWRNTVLMLMSLFFYSWGEPVYIVLIIASIFINWLLALFISKQSRSRTILFIIGVSVNLGCICFFKYFNFFSATLHNIFGITFPLLNVVLPIGISFYTFQAISYLVDVYRGTILPQRNPLYFGTYLSMFPQLIAGPIVRYATIDHELSNRKESIDDFTEGIRRFIIGFGKKVLIANNMAVVADTVLSADPSTIGALPAWYAFAAYSLQIYFDFSGYSDMAIGLGKMFGFNFLENFDYPYISRSITEFWRRWHISLSTFFRDYLYIPLGGNKATTVRWTLNLLIVWSLTGLWHGANWNFVCWGLYYGIILIGEKKIWARQLEQLPSAFQHLYTIFFFMMGWVIFRIDGLQNIIAWFRALFGFNGIGNILVLNEMNIIQFIPWLIIAMLVSTPIPWTIAIRVTNSFITNTASDIFSLLLFLAALTKLATGAFNPFIYFRF